jgi:AcrR family transcriptional regulator
MASVLPESRSEPPDRAPSDTATRILDAAEALFIEHGFAATSVRAIARRASVNLGAAHYHFGSKEGLLGAVVHRRVEPLTQARLEALDAAEGGGAVLSVRDLVEAFFAPMRGPGVVPIVPRLMGRLYGEPDPISRPLIEREFGETFERFAAAFGRALPGVESTDVRWRLHFAIGAMIHQLATERPPRTERDADALERLTAFWAAGIEQACPSTPENHA